MTTPATHRTGPDWFAQSPVGRGLGLALVVCLTAAALADLVIMAAGLLTGRPVPGLDPMAIAGIGLAVVGQVWALLVLRAREGIGPPAFLLRVRWSFSRRLYFSDLPNRVGNALIAVAVLGMVAFVTAIPALSHGGPDGGDAACPYRLSSHAVGTCVSKAAYDRAGAAEQRAGGGVLLAFFALNAGIAAAGRRRVAAPAR